MRPKWPISLPENSALDGGGAGNFASNPIAVTYRTTYEQWAYDHGVDGTADSQLSDEDNDGIPKLLEFAFNLDPAAADHAIYHPALHPASGLPVISVNPGPALMLEYLRRKGVPGLSYTPQFGSTLEDFTDATSSIVVESIDAEWERVTIADPAATGQPHRFGRVGVTLTYP